MEVTLVGSAAAKTGMQVRRRPHQGPNALWGQALKPVMCYKCSSVSTGEPRLMQTLVQVLQGCSTFRDWGS